MKKVLTFVLALACSINIWADEPTMLTIVGGATNAGWTGEEYARTPGRMVKTAEHTWVWAGRLNANEGNNGNFKIPNTATGWNGYWADEADKTLGINDVEEFTLSTNGDGDKKFHVASTGMYRITIDTSTLTMKVEKLSEPAKDGDFYLIGTVDDFMWYAGHVTSGSNEAKARLIADIDFNGKNFFPISSDKYKFRGELDGASHIIDYAIINDPSERLGLCRYLGPGANIHDLVMGEHCSFTGVSKVGGMGGHARDGGEVKFTNVINKATVRATGNTNSNAAGFVGLATDGTKITAKNCANTGSVSGPNECAAFAGWTQDGTTFTNCWNIAEIGGKEGNLTLFRGNGASATNCYDLRESDQATQITEEQIASGEFCYTLNGDQSEINWYQTIGTDDIPVPFSTGHLQVYANGEMRCDGTPVEGGTLTYSNNSTSDIPDHEYENGFCKVCDKYQENAFTATEGWYEVSQPWQLRWMALSVTNHNDTYGTANIKLTADIDYTAYKHDLFGNAQATAFRGIFDGQGHTITIDVVNNGTGRTGLFAYINAATIKNLIVEGSATSAGNNCVGGLGGRSDGNGTLIENVVVKTAVSYTGTNGDATCGGLFANMEAQATLRNCAFFGSINTGTAEGNGGLVGWAGSGSNNKYINCLVAPVEYTKNGNSADFARNNPSLTNCYKVAADDAKLASGELCFLLNGNQSNIAWYQKLGEDDYPMPFAKENAIVYGNGEYLCAYTPVDASSLSYDNTDSRTGDYTSHTDDTKGFCTHCSILLENHIALDGEGFYPLANTDDLNWFSAMVNNVNPEINGKLTDDIDYTSYEGYYTPIGSTSHPYVGRFNGQGHSVTLALNNPGYDYQGLFGVVTDGVFIEKVIVKGYVTGKNYVGGIVGGTNGGSSNAKETKIWYCGNEATITANGTNGAGIIGVNMSGSASIILLNCYNTGAVNSGSDGGALSGWLGGGWSNVRNCYNSGTIKNGENTSKAFCRNNGCYFTNCYYTEGCGTDNSTENTQNGTPAMVADAALASGELCVKLGEAFYQTLGTDDYPTTNFYKPNVYEIKVGNAGYATFVPKKNIAAIPEGVKTFAGQINNNWLHLEEVTLLPKDYAVIVKAAEGSYYCNSTEETRTLDTSNDLTFSNEEVTADGSQYVLAKPEADEDSPQGYDIGFYRAKNGSTIKAGKAYLQIQNAGVKAFYFEMDDATGIAEIENGKLIIENSIYNVAGQKLSKMQKGINIVNGKKILK